MENNIFKYAPNELVQDAFLCWLLNWINIGEDIDNIKEVAKEILSEIINDYDNGIDIRKIDYGNFQIIPQYPIDIDNYKKYDENSKEIFKKKENITKLKGRIDILVIIDKYIIIIEDKVNTNEHDFQIFQYKKALKEKIEGINKKNFDKLNNDERLFYNKEVIACYYKTFDECNIITKSYIDSIFDRERILKILKKYSNIKNIYFSQYISYLERMDYYSNVCNNNIFKIEDLKNDIILKYNIIVDIRYLGLLRALQKWLVDTNISKKPIIFWGKSNEGSRDTWWENIEIDCLVENSETFSEKAFLKINAYENDNIKIRLMIGKKTHYVRNNESRKENIKMIYEYSDIEYNKVKDKSVNTWDTCIIAKYQEKNKDYNVKKKEIFDKLKTEGIIEEIQHQLKDYEVKSGGNSGNYEMTIFTIKTGLNIYSENVYEKLKFIIEVLKQSLKNVKISELQGI